MFKACSHCGSANCDYLFCQTNCTPEKEKSQPDLSVAYESSRKPGRKFIFQRYPQLQYFTNQYIQQNSFQAHAKRRGSGV